MNKTAWILLAGDFATPWRLPKENELIIAADGGIVHAEKLGGRVDKWLGDFDSTSAALKTQYQHISQETFSTDKDQTDFELALDFLAKQHPEIENLFIVGAAGGESDHEFANLWVLARFPFRAVAFGQDATRLIATGRIEWELSGEVGDKVSVFALKPIFGLRYQGLKWGADNMTLAPFFARGCRNCLSKKTAKISWQTGSGAIFLAPNIEVIF